MLERSGFDHPFKFLPYFNSLLRHANFASIKACLSIDEAYDWNGFKYILGYGG